MDTQNLADLYELPALDWSSVTDRLDAGCDQAPGSGGPDRHTTWLTTIDPDGSPHVTGVGSLWGDGCFWFETGQSTRKGRNLARDPRCTVAIATQDFDLVVEGTAPYPWPWDGRLDPSRLALVAVGCQRWWINRTSDPECALAALGRAASAVRDAGGRSWRCATAGPPGCPAPEPAPRARRSPERPYVRSGLT